MVMLVGSAGVCRVALSPPLSGVVPAPPAALAIDLESSVLEQPTVTANERPQIVKNCKRMFFALIDVHRATRIQYQRQTPICATADETHHLRVDNDVVKKPNTITRMKLWRCR